VVLIRILLSGLLFAGLAWSGLQYLGGFGGRRMLAASIASLLKDIEAARTRAIWEKRPFRIVFSDLPARGCYRIEKGIPILSPGQMYRTTSTSYRWEVVVERTIRPRVKAALASASVVYINSDGWFFDHCFDEPWGQYLTPPFLFAQYTFHWAEESLTLAIKGKEIQTVWSP
jgi:hypothetical protein